MERKICQSDSIIQMLQRTTKILALGDERSWPALSGRLPLAASDTASRLPEALPSASGCIIPIVSFPGSLIFHSDLLLLRPRNEIFLSNNVIFQL